MTMGASWQPGLLHNELVLYIGYIRARRSHTGLHQNYNLKLTHQLNLNQDFICNPRKTKVHLQIEIW